MNTVLHHADADGFGAAYALWKNVDPCATFIPVQYGQAVPEIPADTVVLWVVDFSYPLEIMRELGTRFAKVFVVDHHKTAEQPLQQFASEFPQHTVVFDQTYAGAALTWGQTSDIELIPPILAYVSDRDLWKWELPLSEEVNLYVASLPWDFGVWDTFSLDTAVRAGSAIKAFRDGQIDSAKRSTFVGEFLGHSVPIVNCSANISEVGHALLQAYPDHPFAVMYCDRNDGIRTYSLRSRGDFDVSAVCKANGGGGHRAAAGFSAPAPAVI